jgi:hypothetical protein
MITPSLMENGSVCFHPSQNETVVHFECAPSDLCRDHDCFALEVLESHRITIAGNKMTALLKMRNLCPGMVIIIAIHLNCTHTLALHLCRLIYEKLIASIRGGS